jgi:hypothetical protein
MVEIADVKETRNVAAGRIKIGLPDPSPLNLPAGPPSEDTTKVTETEKAVVATTLVVIAAVPAVAAAARAAMETVTTQIV